MSTQKKVTHWYDYNEDINVEEAKEKIAEFGYLLQKYADDVNEGKWNNYDDVEIVELVNSSDFNVIEQILKCNGGVFY
jgi:hypothetical protein